MLEIEFIAWNKNNGQAYDVYSIEFLAGGIKVEGTGVPIGNGWATCNDGYAHDCDVVLLQYTGVKDRNGKKLYQNSYVQLDFGFGTVHDGYIDIGTNGIVIQYLGDYDMCTTPLAPVLAGVCSTEGFILDTSDPSRFEINFTS